MSVQDTFKQFLIHQCTIQRAAPPVFNDPYGNPTPAWQDQYVYVPCRLFEKTEHTEQSERMDTTPVVHYLLLVTDDTDIQEDDRVKMTEGDSRTFIVTSVVQRQLENAAHHLSVELMAVGE
jgi:hypothetical protein